MTRDNRSDLADIDMTWSALKHMHCPAKTRHVALQSDGGEQTLAMRMGSGVHALTFGTPAVHVYDGAVRRGKEWEAFRAAVEEASGPDAIILNVREHGIASGMAAALRDDPLANPLLFGPGVEREQPMAWTVDGRRYRTRGVDFRNRRKKYIGELKQSVTVDPDRFLRDRLRALYPCQVVMYDEGDAILTGRDLVRDPFEKYIIAVEPTPPHVVTVFRLGPSVVRQAQRTIGKFRSVLATCEESNVWPGYAQSVVDLEVEEALTFGEDDGEEYAKDAGPFESATWPRDDATAVDAL